MEITQELLTEKINNGEKLIIDFYAPWCGPCRMMKPTFERVAEGGSRSRRRRGGCQGVYSARLEDR